MLATLAFTGFSVAFLHAIIPTHWLPFVLVARARSWSRTKTLAVSAAAGLGHVALTTLLGLPIFLAGLAADEHLGELFPRIAGGVLLAVGIWYFWRQYRGGVLHHHTPGGAHRPSERCGQEDGQTHFETELQDTRLVSGPSGDWAAIGGLLAMLTLSPCEAFLPVYLRAVEFGWTGFAVLSGILMAGTFAGMLLFTWLTLLGFERLPLRRLERHEALLLGCIFTTLGLMMPFLGHGHAHAH